MWYSASKVEMQSRKAEMVNGVQVSETGERGKVKQSELPSLWVRERFTLHRIPFK